MSESLPGEVSRSVRQLDALWFQYRPERVHVDVRKFRKVALRKWTLWGHITTYADPRNGGAPTRVAFLMLQPGKTLGAEIAAAIVQAYRSEDVPDTLVAHLVMVCSKESKSVAHTFDQSGATHWEALLYEELAINKMVCARVPRYTVLLEPAAREEAMRLLGIQGPDGLTKVSKILFRVDPMARLLGFRVGDLVRVVAPDAMTMETTSFRYVVPEHD